MRVMRLVAILGVAAVLTACGTTPMKETYTHENGEEWLHITKAVDGVWLEAKRLPPIVNQEQSLVHKSADGQPVNKKYEIVTLTRDRWAIRVVSSARKDMCFAMDWRAIDYTVQVPSNWLYVEPGQKRNIGTVIQQAWTFHEKPVTFDDAMIIVNHFVALDRKRWEKKTESVCL